MNVDEDEEEFLNCKSPEVGKFEENSSSVTTKSGGSSALEALAYQENSISQ